MSFSTILSFASVAKSCSLKDTQEKNQTKMKQKDPHTTDPLKQTLNHSNKTAASQ